MATRRRGWINFAAPGVYPVSTDAYAAETVIAQRRAAGKGHKPAAARQVLAATPVAGRVVTGDA